MKDLLTLFLSATLLIGNAQNTRLSPDKSIPIPRLKFDSKGELIIVASATSSKKDFDFLIGKWKLKHRS